MSDGDALQELQQFVGAGGWRPLPGVEGKLIFIRPWPDNSVDTLAVRDETEALAQRTNPVGQPVWLRKGTLIEVVAELREVPAPDALDAPRTVLPGDSVERNL